MAHSAIEAGAGGQRALHDELVRPPVGEVQNHQSRKDPCPGNVRVIRRQVEVKLLFGGRQGRILRHQSGEPADFGLREDKQCYQNP